MLPEAVRLVCKHFGSRLPVIGFCGAPFTLASYMIEGGGSRNYMNTKKMMYSSPAAWDELLGKLGDGGLRVRRRTGARRRGCDSDFRQLGGMPEREDYRRYVLPRTTELVKALQKTGVPIIYFGTDSATLLPSMKETGADVIGLDWRIPLDQGWNAVGSGAVQGNLDPVLLFADWKEIKAGRQRFCGAPADVPGISSIWATAFCPETPVENVKALARFVQEYSEMVAMHQVEPGWRRISRASHRRLRSRN